MVGWQPVPAHHPDCESRSGAIRFQHPPLLSPEEIERYFARSRDARRLSNDGSCVQQLQNRLEAYLGRGLSVALVASGATGLMSALRALLPHDAEARPPLVVFPSHTFIASANVVLWCGRTPLLVDVDRKSWQLDPDVLGLAPLGRSKVHVRVKSFLTGERGRGMLTCNPSRGSRTAAPGGRNARI
jgi:dTDP-4-amino-4,6-dideoxygalactose transaminase